MIFRNDDHFIEYLYKLDAKGLDTFIDELENQLTDSRLSNFTQHQTRDMLTKAKMRRGDIKPNLLLFDIQPIFYTGCTREDSDQLSLFDIDHNPL